MQLPYSDDISVEFLSRIFDKKSESYKLFWFQAIVNKVIAGKQMLTYNELINEMIADSWYMVVRRQIVGGGNRILNSVKMPPRLHSSVGDRRFSADSLHTVIALFEEHGPCF